MRVSNTELGYLKSVEDSVNEYLKSKEEKPRNGQEMFRVLERALSHIVPGARFHAIVSERKTDDPFIMGIYPDMKELNAKAELLLTYMEEGKDETFMKEWASIKDWVIEIDPRILAKNSLIRVDDGAQFVAIVCHEVGHVLAGNALSLIENYAYQKKAYTKAERMIFSKNALVRKFALPIFVCTLQFRMIWKNPGGNLRDEIMADHYIPDEYREAMVSYVENHILTNPIQSQVITTKSELDADQKTSIAFSKECIRMMSRRRDAIKNSIKMQYDKGNSQYMADLVSDIGKSAMGYDPKTNMTNAVYESTVLRSLERDVESCTKDATTILEGTSVTPRDISILRVQADDINTVDQKLFIVHTIYDYLEALQTQKEKLMRKQGVDASKATFVQDAQIAELNDILQKVMKIDVSGVGDRYGIFIKYPKGYEG